MTGVRQWVARGAERLAAAGIGSANLDARVLLARAMDVPSEALVFAAAPSTAQLERYETLIARRESREPLAYVTGCKEFWSSTFEVGPGVLVPRPDTETLLDEVLRAFPDHAQPLDVLDLGTGSGCLLIAFLSQYSQARGVGVDELDAALAWARRNADRNGVAQRCTWLRGGWAAAQERTFDVILSNPPYLAAAEHRDLAPEIARHEPREALFAGEDGLDAYRALAPVIAKSLRPGGWSGVEIGAGQQDRVCEIIAGAGLEIARVAPDLSGTPRCVVIRPILGVAEKTVGNSRSSR